MRHHKANLVLLFTTISLFAITAHAQTSPTDQAAAIDYLVGKGVTFKTDQDGHAIRLMSSGKPALTVDEYQLIGRLPHLEQIGINAAPLADDEWQFLKKLPKLKSLSIWHGKGFATLKPFSRLRIESLTIGGCMGLRDLNKDHKDAFLNSAKTLRDLPNLTRLSLYHSPLSPDDSHIAHVVEQFPKLEDLRLDFAAPRGSATTVTPKGLQALHKLPLKVLFIENAGGFSTEHLESLAGIASLETLLVDARKQPAPPNVMRVFTKLRPNVDVVIAGPKAKGPPRARRR